MKRRSLDFKRDGVGWALNPQGICGGFALPAP